MIDTRAWVDRTTDVCVGLTLVLIIGAVLLGIVAAPTMVIYWWLDLSGTWPLIIDVVLIPRAGLAAGGGGVRRRLNRWTSRGCGR
ncbi:hypothetical protein [Nocardia brasiliensis]|uniref:hypothetical protein n=1 Tax=Nocardia brasiliensis TaxID=37326 RepID=UPI0004A6D987|nr:hypothetical protein [Nocardia brasiliensis]